MPAYHGNEGRWLGKKIAGMSGTVAALAAQQTAFIVNPAGVCVTITGNLEFDNRGNPTGLGAEWGIGSFKTGSWVQVA